MRPIRAAIAGGLAGGMLLLALSGCAQLQPMLHEQFPDSFGPYRGEDGAVLEPVAAHAKYLEVGDCFDFASPHPDNPAETDDPTRVVITPCDDDHVFEVIGAGEIGYVEQQTLGLDVAISTECAEPFEAWAADVPEGQRADQEFLVREERIEDRTATLYTCIAAQQKL